MSIIDDIHEELHDKARERAEKDRLRHGDPTPTCLNCGANSEQTFCSDECQRTYEQSDHYEDLHWMDAAYWDKPTYDREELRDWLETRR